MSATRPEESETDDAREGTHSPTSSVPAPARRSVAEFTGVSKKFGSVQALHEVDLRVRSGLVYGVLGPNGAGKTTLLRVVLGLVRPDAGSVTVLGHRPGQPGALAHIGALIESPAFVPHLSGRANLRVLARARGLPDDEVARVLRVMDLQDRADERFHGYSLGMGQRLGVAAALLGNPPLLILDEPTNGLDPQGVASMREFIRRLGEDGTTVLLSSHLLSEVQQICDRVVVINRGRVIADDTVTALRDHSGTTVLKVWVSPVEQAGQVLDQHASEAGVTLVEDSDDPYWRLETTPETVPELVNALVKAGIAVYEVRRERPSLEDVFFGLTRDETTDASVPPEGVQP
ncbi:ATP-binding cassette domain-containing protein [Phytoactinopolyspora sp. XMNu-373]|uniref:ATP-binding cassette domain-containing protein n=1 Tax=Phytoactinopolyspora mesophila TaxID=2650750 RepID=A0A7K3MAF0_9ACTN|nr:ATP-binding cassette domain-containing protein [Phytoactinopolyspora mesophila]